MNCKLTHTHTYRDREIDQKKKLSVFISLFHLRFQQYSLSKPLSDYRYIITIKCLLTKCCCFYKLIKESCDLQHANIYNIN